MPVQIMMVLTQQRERPEIPPLDTLPGQPLPGIGEYILLMQVRQHVVAWVSALLPKAPPK